MFKDFTDLGVKRNPREAFVFYFAYLVLFILSGGLIAGILSSFTNSERAFQTGLMVVNFLVFLAVLIISLIIAKKKRLLKDVRYIALILLGGLLTLWGGGILGLIVPAFLTTVPRYNKKKEGLYTKHLKTKAKV